MFPHALSRPRYGDRWKGYSPERSFPIQQAPPLEHRYSLERRSPPEQRYSPERRSLPEQRFPPEQPHHMTPERSKFVSESEWGKRFGSSQRSSRVMVPPHPLQASHHPQGPWHSTQVPENQVTSLCLLPRGVPHLPRIWRWMR